MTERTATARLLGSRNTSGGAPALPEVFSALLTTLADGPASERALLKIIREQAGYKDARILDRWGSWDAFLADLLDVLEGGGWITRNESDTWMVTRKVQPGARMTLLYDPDSQYRVRVIIFPAWLRQAREDMQRARNLLNPVILHLGGSSDSHPALVQALDYLRKADDLLQEAISAKPGNSGEPGNSGKQEPVPGNSGKQEPEGGKPNYVRPRSTSVRSGQAAWYRNWMQTAGWHTFEEVRTAYNASHPAEAQVRTSSGSWRGAALKLAREGILESRRRDSSMTRWLTYEYRLRGGDGDPDLREKIHLRLQEVKSRMVSASEIAAHFGITEADAKRELGLLRNLRLVRSRTEHGRTLWGNCESVIRQRAGLASWYREWAPTTGWHTMDDAKVAWNAVHPAQRLGDSSNDSLGSIRRMARELTGEGLLESRRARGGPWNKTEYRYTGTR